MNYAFFVCLFFIFKLNKKDVAISRSYRLYATLVLLEFPNVKLKTDLTLRNCRHFGFKLCYIRRKAENELPIKS